MSRALVFALGLALGLAACGDNGGSTIDAAPPVDAPLQDATPRQSVDDDILLVPGEIIEVILTGGPGDHAGIHLEAPIPKLEWNIHGHANGGTQIVHEAFDRMTDDYVFIPSAQADWYLLIRNGATTDMTVKLQVDLYGAMTFEYF